MKAQPEKQVVTLTEYISRDVVTDMMAVLEGSSNIEGFLRVVESWAKFMF